MDLCLPCHAAPNFAKLIRPPQSHSIAYLSKTRNNNIMTSIINNANTTVAATEQATPQRITSLFVYRCPMQTTGQEVKQVVDQLLGGDTVRRVDVVLKKANDGKSFKSLFVHFNAWPNTDVACQIEADILNGKSVDIIYSGTRFWRANLNKLPEPRDLYTQSIFMPRVNADTTEDQIKDVFATAFHGPDDENKSSHITRVNLIPKKDKNDKPYNTVYIHFAEWEMTESAKHFMYDATNEGGATLQWGDGTRDTWLCLLNRNTMGGGTTIDKREAATATKVKKTGPYITLSDNVAGNNVYNIPATPAPSPSISGLPPPVLRRQVAGGRIDHDITGTNLMNAFNPVDSSQRAGVSNVPAWIASQNAQMEMDMARIAGGVIESVLEEGEEMV